MDLSPEAKVAWVEFHDAVESELVSGGELFDVRDVASKTAENAARLAVLFEVFEGGSHTVSAESFDRASRVALWHLSESRRFFGELAIPQIFTDAMRLDEWMIGECTRRMTEVIPAREAQQYGPVRDHGRLQAAISELDSLSRARLVRDGKRKLIAVNPEILRGGR